MREYESLVENHETIGGKYRVDRLLGEGGMGLVVAATHLELDETVAIKLVYRDIIDAPGMRDRFVNEARATARLKGPHVTRVRDVGALEDGTPFLVMEYLTGIDLGKVVESGPLAIDLAVEYVLQACEAVAEAHGAGIVHRDLKPANLFLATESDGSELVKVVDFGISSGVNVNARITSDDSVLGTPAYMSPEQMRSARLADARSDVWSIGVVLYELVEGTCPFSAESFAALCVQIAIHDPIPMQQPVPPGLQRAIWRCLDKEPEKRFQNVSELAHAIAPYSRDLATIGQRLARIERVGRRSASSPGIVTPPPQREASTRDEAAVAAIRDARRRVAMPALGRDEGSS